MVSIMFFISVYMILVTLSLLFFYCANYKYDPCIAVYDKRKEFFYKSFVSKLKTKGENISPIFYSDNFFGCYYRHYLVKDYLFSESKLRNLSFTDKEIKEIHSTILPGFEKSEILFIMIKILLLFFTILMGIIIGLCL